MLALIKPAIEAVIVDKAWQATTMFLRSRFYVAVPGVCAASWHYWQCINLLVTTLAFKKMCGFVARRQEFGYLDEQRADDCVCLKAPRDATVSVLFLRLLSLIPARCGVSAYANSIRKTARSTIPHGTVRTDGGFFVVPAPVSFV